MTEIFLKNYINFLSQQKKSTTVADSFKNLIELSKNVLEVKRVLIFLYNDEEKEFFIVSGRNVSEDDMKKCTIQKGEGIIGNLDKLNGFYYYPETSSVTAIQCEEELFSPGALIAPISSDDKCCRGAFVVVDSLDNLKKQEITNIIKLLVHEASIINSNILLYTELERKMNELAALIEIGNEIVSTLNLDKVLELIIERAQSLLGCEIISLLLPSEENPEVLVIKKAIGLPEEVVKNARVVKGKGISGKVFETGMPILIKNIEETEYYNPSVDSKRYNNKSLLSVPLKSKGHVIGVINVNNKKNNQVFTQSDLNLLSLFATQASIAIENAKLHHKVQNLAVTDGLTGLYNRVYFIEQLKSYFKIAKINSRPLSIIIADIDHFKQINDTYGHQAGDRVLVKLAQIFKNGIRENDIAARYGGEEFILLLKWVPSHIAVKIAERLRKNLENAKIEGIDRQITMSMGIASLPGDFETVDDFIKEADKNLYEAKRSGRNRVVVAK